VADRVIAEPILNGPYAEPSRHFQFGAAGITDEIVEGRRPSSYFVPVPRPRKGVRQLEIAELTADEIEVRAGQRRAQRGGRQRPAARMELKMATGSGKIVVMAMLIAWQTLNKVAALLRHSVAKPGLRHRPQIPGSWCSGCTLHIDKASVRVRIFGSGSV